MKKFALVAVALAALAAAPVAEAGSLGRPCTNAPESEWLSLDALKAKVEALGYTVQKAKLKNSCGELYAHDKSGARAEIFVDPKTGEIVGRL